MRGANSLPNVPVNALAVDPTFKGKTQVVYAGTDFGLYRSDDGGAKWRLLENPMKGSVVWSMAIDPIDPSVMFAGIGTPTEGARWSLIGTVVAGPVSSLMPQTS